MGSHQNCILVRHALRKLMTSTALHVKLMMVGPLSGEAAWPLRPSSVPREQFQTSNDTRPGTSGSPWFTRSRSRPIQTSSLAVVANRIRSRRVLTGIRTRLWETANGLKPSCFYSKPATSWPNRTTKFSSSWIGTRSVCSIRIRSNPK
jgi:hypothetical protein